MRSLKSLWLSATIIITATYPVRGDELLRGTIVDSKRELTFILSGEDRQNVIGGVIILGDKKFTITHISRLGTIGARHDSGDSREFAVFSSSFSEQTATGQPWVVSKRYIGCDQPYNSFLALYQVKNQDTTLQSLTDIPYADLTDNIAKSSMSEVYCFVSRPPA
jgi:hypothetical protein